MTFLGKRYEISRRKSLHNKESLDKRRRKRARGTEKIRMLDIADNYTVDGYTATALYCNPATFVDVTDIGDMDTLCPHCDAVTFPDKIKGVCCNNWKVSMPLLPSTPGALLELFSGNHHLSQHFLN